MNIVAPHKNASLPQSGVGRSFSTGNERVETRGRPANARPDGLGRPTRFKRPANAGGPRRPTRTWGLDRRTKQRLGDNNPRHSYYNNNWQVLEEWVRTGRFIALHREYYWHFDGIDRLAARIDWGPNLTTGVDEEKAWITPLQDVNDNVVAILREPKQAGGSLQIVENYLFDAYGQPKFFDANWTPRTASAHDWDLLFGGYRYDAATGLYLVRNRVYHPSLGRWLQRDPMGYADSSLRCSPVVPAPWVVARLWRARRSVGPLGRNVGPKRGPQAGGLGWENGWAFGPNAFSPGAGDRDGARRESYRSRQAVFHRALRPKGA